MTGETSELAKVDYAGTFPKAHSLWHCRSLCSLYTDCVWVSWKKSVEHLDDPDQKECRLMQELPTNVPTLTYTIVNKEWTSSSVNCTIVAANFESNY